MDKQKHNGWANYATWRINLEWFDSIDLTEWGSDNYERAQAAYDHVRETIEESSTGYARDYALAFITEVNWREIVEAHTEEKRAA